MTNESTLSEILNETGPQPDLNPPEPEAEAPDAETPAEGAEAEAGPDTPDKTEQPASEPEKGDKEPDAPPAPADEKKEPDAPQVPIASLHDERRKRQELERRLAAIEQERTKEPVPDPVEDPEAYDAYQDKKRQTERLQDRVAVSEDIVRLHVGEDEYAKAEEAFVAEMERDPSLANQAMADRNPAMFMYKTGKAALDRQEIGDPREFAAKQVAAALEKQKADNDAYIEKMVQEKLSELVPKSLADNASAGARSEQKPVDDGPTPIEQLLPK